MDQIVVVEDDIAVEAGPEENPTNRPPASVEPEPILLKPRAGGNPASGPTPAARRR